MPIFRRFGRPGLLGAVTRNAIVAGTSTMTARAVGRARLTGSGATAEAAAYRESPTPTAPIVVQESISSQLALLSSLRQSGEISDDEYVRIKMRLLG